MDYMQTNKAAWEEAFEMRHKGWGDNVVQRLQTEHAPFLNPAFREALLKVDVQGKTVAQFCCNNGREILSVMQLGAKAGVGFDIAQNMIDHARESARQTGLPCTFEAMNILDIDETYTQAFDVVFFTIGAITWFQDLSALFAVAVRCLKPGGSLLLEDFHPFMNMLPLPGEEAFDAEDPSRMAFSYFRSEPWLESNSGAYMTNHQNSHTFTSFSHTMAGIITKLVEAGLCIVSLQEFDMDIGITDAYDHKGFPLSMILRADKP